METGVWGNKKFALASGFVDVNPGVNILFLYLPQRKALFRRKTINKRKSIRV